MTRKEMKAAAKQQIKGNIFILLLVNVIAAAISATFIGIIFAPVLNIGITLIYLNLTAGEKAKVGVMFSRFKLWFKALWMNIRINLGVWFASLILIFPGIICSLERAMAPYILAEHPELRAGAAIHKSIVMMKGHKRQLFALQLSFIPWLLLCCVTCGIAGIYVVPYMNAATANFYNNIKGE